MDKKNCLRCNSDNIILKDDEYICQDCGYVWDTQIEMFIKR